MYQPSSSSSNSHSSFLQPEEEQRVSLQCIPGAWIEHNHKEFIKTVSSVPPKLSLLIEEEDNNSNIELLRQTIENLRKEKEKLEETNNIVKKSIQIVAKKRLIAQTNTIEKRTKKNEQDVYIFVSSNDFIPTQDEMKAAGLDGWEWVSAY